MKKIKYNIKSEFPLILMVVTAFAISLYFYPMLPDMIPTHWNFKGEVDAYSGKLLGAFLLPGINFITYVLFLVLPLLDPKRENYKLFKKTYIYFRYLFHILFLGFHIILISAALGYNLDIGRLVMLGVSLLFIFMGNVMGRLKHNYFVGIKTPWTLASEEVWKKTHRLSAILWTAAGFLGVVFTLFKIHLSWSFIIILLAPSVISVIYSYILFNKLKKTGKI